MKPLPQIILIPIMLSVLACGPASTAQSNQTSVAGANAARPAVPLTGRVTDAAHILSPEQSARLSSKLQQLERSTAHQLVVATVPTLQGRDVGDFTKDLANAWGIGRKDNDDGVVLLVAPTERKVRIAVGYGLESKLTHEVCQRIIDEAILPRFRDGDLGGGIEAGTDALIARLS